MTKVYIVRHAEAEGNLYRRIHGQYDSLLTEMGMRQLEALRKRFENIHIDAVYSSDLYRARMTASAIYEPKSLPLVTMPELREVSMGIWEDVCWAEVERFMPEQYRFYNTEPHKWCIEGCESFYRLSERIMGAITSLAKKHEGQSIAVVTHGGAIRSMLCNIMGLPPEEICKVYYCDNTAVSLLVYENGKFKIEYMNDNSHLPDELSAFKRQTWWKEKTFTDNTNMYFRPMDLDKRGERYLECYRDSWREAHGDLSGFTDAFLDRAKARSREFPMSVTEAYLGDKPIGVLELNTERDADKGAGCIAFYYIDKEYRGKGLAVQLLGQATSVYRKLGRKTLRLRVAKTNKRAINFYRKHGFKHVATEQGAVCPLLVMEKNIALE
ncbi:MAG TPA: GNAT family N-acetyltransferase [Clostridiales bacterium]|jgi:probable phosphoglycerate mutase|nr:GNAT family N-acetyltransferase [Clostridiales bacterium]